MTEFLLAKNAIQQIERIQQAISINSDLTLAGKVTKITGMKIEVVGINEPIGTICKIVVSSERTVNAEVIGFSGTTTYLMACEEIVGIKQGTLVLPIANTHSVNVGMNMLGRIIDATGQVIDDGPPIETEEVYPLASKPINPLKRARITEPLDVGIRTINALLTVGKGQRIGIFAGSGVGKSVLLGMMTRFTQAHIVVVGLIGERGREVKEFIEESLGPEGLAKSVVVASPADTSPLMRVNGAALATTIAEYYRDKGFDVLLIVDSLTRYAQAQREISLAVGEMPATKGFTPSVFAKLSQLIERSGTGAPGQGSITAFYTVLIEGDDHNDPIGDHARSVLDGHVFLSRQLADSGHYPAIDIELSISRVMPNVIDTQQMQCATLFKRLYSAYNQNRDIINVGMYQAGTDRTIDEAIKYKDEMLKFLMQGMHEAADMQLTLKMLNEVFKPK